MGTDMRMTVQRHGDLDWYNVMTLMPRRDYDIWRWLGRLGAREPGVSPLALRGLPADVELSDHAAEHFDEAGYSHSWAYLSELLADAPDTMKPWLDELQRDIGLTDPETTRLIWSFAY